MTASIIEKEAGPSTLIAVRDITATKESEARALLFEERFRLVFEQANEAIFLSDPEGLILDANPAASRLTGYDLEEIRSMNVQDLHEPSGKHISEAELDKVRHGTFQGFSATGICKDGTLRHCAVTVSIIHMGARKLVLSMVMEIPEPHGLRPLLHWARNGLGGYWTDPR